MTKSSFDISQTKSPQAVKRMSKYNEKYCLKMLSQHRQHFTTVFFELVRQNPTAIASKGQSFLTAESSKIFRQRITK